MVHGSLVVLMSDHCALFSQNRKNRKDSSWFWMGRPLLGCEVEPSEQDPPDVLTVLSVFTPDTQKKKVPCMLVCLWKRQRRWTLCICALVHL